jgi:hypothetical protein
VDSRLNLPTALSAITEALNETCSEQHQENKTSQIKTAPQYHVRSRVSEVDK